MTNDEQPLNKLIAGGLIGAAFGAILSKDKEEGAFFGAILGAIITGTFNASKEAQKTSQGVLIAEDGKLFDVMPDGKRKFIKNLSAAKHNWPQTFKLK